MEILSSKKSLVPPMIAVVYGPGGVGKSTLATTAPKPVFIDAENGTKAFGIRGIDVPVAHVKSWEDVRQAWAVILENPAYETVVIDPIGKFLDLLIEQVSAGGEMNMRKWGEAKKLMYKFISVVKDSGKHVVFVAHEDKDKDEDVQLRRPMLAANLSQPLVDMSDVVGHLRVDANGERSLRVQPEPKFVAKDRFSLFGETVKNPNFSRMIDLMREAYDRPPFESASDKLPPAAPKLPPLPDAPPSEPVAPVEEKPLTPQGEAMKKAMDESAAKARVAAAVGKVADNIGSA